METNASHISPNCERALLAHARPFEPDPPAVDGTCGRCGFGGADCTGRLPRPTLRGLLRTPERLDDQPRAIRV
jgi:hypothetical protein